MKKNECVCGCVRKWHEEGMGICFNHQPPSENSCGGFQAKYPKLQKKRWKNEYDCC